MVYADTVGDGRRRWRRRRRGSTARGTEAACLHGRAPGFFKEILAIRRYCSAGGAARGENEHRRRRGAPLAAIKSRRGSPDAEEGRGAWTAGSTIVEYECRFRAAIERFHPFAWISPALRRVENGPLQRILLLRGCFGIWGEEGDPGWSV